MQFKMFLNDFVLIHALYVLSTKVLLGGKNGIYVKALLLFPVLQLKF
jgi:hypothetical protein